MFFVPIFIVLNLTKLKVFKLSPNLFWIYKGEPVSSHTINKNIIKKGKNKKKLIAEIIISKQRNGPIGNFYLKFEKSTTRFSNLN